MPRKREKTGLELLIDDMHTVDLRLRLADSLPDAAEQKRTALKELEDIKESISIQIKNLRADM